MPVNAHSGEYDAFVVCLNISGQGQWNTFLGSSTYDYGRAIALDSSGYIYIVGDGYASWGSPVNAHSGSRDAFAVCLNSSGQVHWNTFLGSDSTDFGRGICVDGSGNIYMTGDSSATWGLPVFPYSGNSDSFAVCLNSSGYLEWNTFLGSWRFDHSNGITLDGLGNIYLVGDSDTTWGSPVNAHCGDFNYDTFVAKLFTPPIPDIIANGLDGPISITESDTLQIQVSLISFGSTVDTDFWLAYKGPSGWVHYNNTTKKWESGLGVTHQGALMDLNNKKVFQSSGLTPGNYTFYFGVDMVMDGNLTKSELYYDEVKVTVTQ